jgi:hypothetical protein
MLESWPIAAKLIDRRMEAILERLVNKMQEKGEYLLSDSKILGFSLYLYP